MEIDDLIIDIYQFLIDKLNISDEELKVIIDNDIRVENFFTIKIGQFLALNLSKYQIKTFEIQKHLHDIDTKTRKHIDLIVEFNDATNLFIELKHGTISGKKKNARRLYFYTNNSAQGSKVGIVKDCKKLDLISNREVSHKLCLMLITNKPSEADWNLMIKRLKFFPESKDWKIILPLEFDKQDSNIACFALYK